MRTAPVAFAALLLAAPAGAADLRVLASEAMAPCLGPALDAFTRESRVPVSLAVGAPEGATPGIDAGRIEEFADRDQSENSHRTAILVAGLAGLGRIDGTTAGQLNRQYKLGLGAQTGWTRMIDGAMRRRQAGTVLLLTASALQSSEFADIRGVYLYHAVTALRRTGQEYLARMILAEALART